MRAFPPITLPDDRSRYGAPGFRDHAFNLIDAQGMYRVGGPRTHGGTDWFGAEGQWTPVYAPQSGKVVEARRTNDRVGQVFGGTLKIQTPSGIVWVMRHVDPKVSVGQTVDAGQQVANVTRWIDAGDHLHLEIWKRLGGGYWYHNAIDPKTVNWDQGHTSHEIEKKPDLYLDLRINGKQWKVAGDKGWADAGNALRWLAKNDLKDSATASIAWRGPKRKGEKPHVWRTPAEVTAVARSIHNSYGRFFR